MLAAFTQRCMAPPYSDRRTNSVTDSQPLSRGISSLRPGPHNLQNYCVA